VHQCRRRLMQAGRRVLRRHDNLEESTASTSEGVQIYMQLIERARPTTQYLDEVVRNATMSHDASSPSAKAVARKTPMNARR